MKEGNIILLTRRKGSLWNVRTLVSYLIAYFSTKNKSMVDSTITHTGIIFSDNNEWMVRDMDTKGDRHFTFKEYVKLYGDRMVVRENPKVFNTENVIIFNRECKHNIAEYDFANLLFFQLVKSIFGVFIGGRTIKKRICSEDTTTMYNILENLFENPEEKSPSDVDEKTKNWTELTISEINKF